MIVNQIKAWDRVDTGWYWHRVKLARDQVGTRSNLQVWNRINTGMRQHGIVINGNGKGSCGSSKSFKWNLCVIFFYFCINQK